MKSCRYLSLFFLVISLAFYQCREDEDDQCWDPTNPECCNYDPCYQKEAYSAEVEIFEGFLNYSWSDTVLRGNNLVFTSPIEDDKVEHTWYLGSEVFKGSQTPGRRFDDVSRPATLSITHVIEYEPDSICLPLDDGYDSVIQEFYLIDKMMELNTYGEFRGAFEGTSDSFDFQILPLDRDGNLSTFTSQYETVFVNLENNQDSLFTVSRDKNPNGEDIAYSPVNNHAVLGATGIYNFYGGLDVFGDNEFKLAYKWEFESDSIIITGKTK